MGYEDRKRLLRKLGNKWEEMPDKPFVDVLLCVLPEDDTFWTADVEIEAKLDGESLPDDAGVLPVAQKLWHRSYSPIPSARVSGGWPVGVGDLRACILTGQDGENADDCTTHEHVEVGSGNGTI